MKLGEWHQDMIRFMRHASEYGDYYEKLAEKVAPFLHDNMRLCDAGSGLGYLSLALAPYVKHVTAVEIHPDAAGVLADNCEKSGISNVKSQCGEIAKLQPEQPYDAMVFCFFGKIPEILAIAKNQCKGDVFIFTRNYTQHRFSAGSHETGYGGFRQTQAYLQQLGIPMTAETFSLEFGQPFRDLHDVRLFFERYSMDQDKSVLTDEFLLGKVKATGRMDFPLYMPHEKQMAFIRFSALDIPDHIE